ncbi:MAG: hypothetical protein GIW95_06400 [Candidatus Eremiobacteraeota bacterium]|nr:hypothetical protein [Candidatus Eremiobacteraeota bacterium]
MMRLWAFFIAIASFSLAGLSYWSRHIVPTPPAVALIGVELPLAGNDGATGVATASAIRLAIEEAQKRAWTGVRVAADVRDGSHHGYANPHTDEGRDDVGEVKAASTILNDFIRSPAQVVAAVGGLTPPVAATLARDAEKRNLPLLTIAPLPVRCSASFQSRMYAASIAGNAAREASAAATFARSRHYRRLAILDDGEPERRKVADCLGIITLQRERESEIRLPAVRTESGYYHALNTIALRGVDAFAFVGPESRGTLLCPARAAGRVLKPEFLKSTFHRNFDSKALPRNCGWIRRTVHAHDRRAYAAFVAHYRARYGSKPPPEAAGAYAATQIAIAAIRGANGGEAPLRDKVLRSMRDRSFSTVLGNVRLDSHGEPDWVWFAFDRHTHAQWFDHREIAVNAKLK